MIFLHFLYHRLLIDFYILNPLFLELGGAGALHFLFNIFFAAKTMVKKLAMSEKLGMTYFDDASIAKGLISDPTKLLIEEEVNRILNESYKRAMNILRGHQNELQDLVAKLIEHGTLDRNAIEQIIEGERINKNEKLYKKCTLNMKFYEMK